MRIGRKEGFLAIIFAFAGFNTGIAPVFHVRPADVSAAIRRILGIRNISRTKEE